MPTPVSSTVILTASLCILALIVNLPPRGIAWMALLTRFVKTRVVKVLSSFICGISFSQLKAVWMFSGITMVLTALLINSQSSTVVNSGFNGLA
jgi:hypothetical protein